MSGPACGPISRSEVSVHLSKVEIKNFMSFEYAVREFKDNGLILVQGENGAGKSSIWDAVSWAIFGKTVRGVDGDDVVHWGAGEDCAVTVSFSLGNDYFEVTRHRRGTDKDDKGSLLGNRLRIAWKPHGAEDEEIVELGSIDATQTWLLDVARIDFELFRCTVLFAQEETFNFVSATDKKQKEILSKVKRLNFETGLATVRGKLKELMAEVQEIDTKLVVLHSHQRAGAATFDDEVEDWDRTQKARVKDKLVEIKRLEEEIVEMESKVVDVSKAEEVIQRVVQAGNKLKDERRTLRDKRDIVQRKIGFFQGKLKEIKKLGDKCPVCEQEVSKATVSAHADEIEAELIGRKAADEIMSKRLDELDPEIDSLREKEDRLRTKIVENRQYATGANVKKVDIKKINDAIARLRAEENPFRKKAEEAKAKMEKINEAVVKFEKRRLEAQEQLPYYNFWEIGFSDKGMKSFVFDSLCAVLTAKANHYLGIMSDGFLAVTFDTQTRLKSGELREKFECMVLIDGKKVPFESYSGGEKTRISLAVDMALASLMMDTYGANEFNVVVFDEQDQFLDAKGRAHYLKLLRERAKTQTVFVVSHDAELKSRFENVWTVVKENGVSRFE